MAMKNDPEVLCCKSMSMSKVLKNTGFESGKQKEATICKKEIMLCRAVVAKLLNPLSPLQSIQNFTPPSPH
jgi:hypothetical protein